MPVPPPPSTREALLALRRDHPALLEDIGKRSRALWIGSGISRDQVPPLAELLRCVLVFLRDTAVVPEPEDPHFGALTRIVEHFLPAEGKGLRENGTAWSPPTDLTALVHSYSEVLSEIVDPEPRDYLLWTALDVCHAYGDPSIKPGPEHELVAILIAERVVESIVTTNWDALIERAVENLTPPGDLSPLATLMSNEDFRTARGVCELYKMHGCAVRASLDETQFRPYLVATTPDIAEWGSIPHYTELRERIGQLVRNRASLVLGLSVQDANILNQLAKQSIERPWPWDPARPAYVFADLGLESGHRHVLEVAYGTDYDNDRSSIGSASLARMYSGPLLAALVVHVWTRKFEIALETAVDLVYTAAVRTALMEGLAALEDGLLTSSGPNLAELVRTLKDGASRLTGSFAEPSAMPPAGTYSPIFPGSTSEMIGSPQFRQSQIPRLAVVLGLLGVGRIRRDWSIVLTVGHGPDAGELTVRTARRSTPARLIIVRDEQAASLVKGSPRWIGASTPIVLVHASGTRQPQLPRGPRRGIGSGRTVRLLHREAWLSELESSTSDPGLFYDAFRAEVSI